MANQVTNRTVNIYIQSGEAQKALDKLLDKEKKLNDQLAITADPKRQQKLKADLEKLSEPIDRLKKKISGELNPSLRDTESTVTKLRNEIKHFTGSEADLQKLVTAYKAGNKELEAQKSNLGLLRGAMRSFMSEAKTVAVGVLVGNTLQAGLEKITGYFNSLISNAGKLSDELADIQRVTGLTAGEVQRLNSELKKLDTRTSAGELRGIAVIAGKLGIAKDELLGFVAAVDKLNVALGDELGDVGQITEQLGKILNVFDGQINGENITRLGNAIVDMANKGVASGPFIVDFAQRVGGIAKAANVSLGAVIGLAAGLEEQGSKVESSATAVSKLFVTIAQDIPKAAKIAGIEAQKFAEIFAKTPEEALLLFAQGLQKNKGSFAEVAAGFKDAGEEGARVIEVLSKLGTATDFFRGKISESGVALQNTSAISDAFALKNETLQGTMDKLGKTIARWFTGSELQTFLQNAIRGVSDLITPTKTATEQFDELDGQVKSLESDIVPLLKRHDELKEKTTLSKDEQEELRKIIKRVSDQVPFAVTAFDDYGNAISISTGRVYEFIEAEKARLKVVNKDAIAENQKQLDRLAKQIAATKRDLDQLAATGSFTVTEFTGGTGGGAPSTRKANEKEVRAKQDLYRQLLEQQRGYMAEVKRLNGDAIQEQVDAAKASAKQKADEVATQATVLATTSNLNTKAADKAQKERERIAKEIEKAIDDVKRWGREIAAENGGAMEKEIGAATEKYLALKEKLHGHQEEMKVLEQTYINEVLQIRARYGEKDAQQFDEMMKRREKILEGLIQKIVDTTSKQKIATPVLDQQNDKDVLAILKAKGNQKTNLVIKQLEAERSIILQSTTLTESERYAKIQAIEEKIKNLRLQKLDEWLGALQAASDLLGGFYEEQNARENAELDRDKRINDKKRENLEHRLRKGLISQQQYDAEVEKIQKAQDKKQHEIQVKQFKRSQRMQVLQALMSGAQAVTSTIAAIPGPVDILSLGIARSIQIGLMVAATAAQVAKIASQKPPEYGRGGQLVGRSHRQGGMGVYDEFGRKQAEVEGGEMIGSKKTATDSRRYRVEGTPSQIFSLLNGINGGVQWTTGGRIVPGWSTGRQPAINFSALQAGVSTLRRFADGGVFQRADAGSQKSEGAQDVTGMIGQLAGVLGGLQSVLAAMQRYGVEAHVSIGSIKDAEARLAALDDESTMR